MGGGGAYYQEGAKFSEGQEELNSQRKLDSGGLHYFSATMLFLSQHCYKLFISVCLYSNIFEQNP